MTEQAKAGSAWPEPPTFYQRYTTENLEQAKLLKHGRSNSPDGLDFPIELLEPPPPIEGSYVVFDQHWQVRTMSDMRCECLVANERHRRPTINCFRLKR